MTISRNAPPAVMSATSGTVSCSSAWVIGALIGAGAIICRTGRLRRR